MTEDEAHQAILCLMYEGRLVWDSLTASEIFESFIDGDYTAIEALAMLEAMFDL